MRINGNLILNTDGSGTVQQAFIETYAGGVGGGSLPVMTSKPGGRIIFNTSDNYFYYWNGTTWISFASGTTSVSSFNTTLSGLTPQTASTGAVTLAGTLGATSGGTGQSTYTTGDILYASSSSALSKLNVGGAHQVLHGGTTPSYGAVDLAADVSGILPSTNGGTGVNNAYNITLGGALTTGGAFTTTPSNAVTLTTTGATNVTLPTSGTLLTAATGVTTAAGTTSEILVNGGTAAVSGAVVLSLPSALIAPGSVQTTGNLTVGGFTFESSTTGIAAAGTDQSHATLLTVSYNVVTTSTASTAPFNGVLLPASGGGNEITVVNASTHSIYVYAAGSDVIDGEDASGAGYVTLPSGGTATYQSVNSGNWYTIDPVITVSGAGLGLAYSPGQTILTNTGVTSFSTGSTGLSSGSTGAVVLSGILNAANGGTGINNGSNTITAGGNVNFGGAFTTTSGNAITLTTTGATNVTLPTSGTLATTAGTVASITGTANEITASAATGAVTLSVPSTFVAPGSVTATTTLTVSGNTADAFLYSGAGGVVASTAAATNGQILIGSTGNVPVAATLTGTAGQIGVTNGAGSITLTNLGVLTLTSGTTSNSLTVTSNTAATGAVTVDVNLNTMLDAFGQLAGTGLIVQTGAATFSEVTITGTSGNIVVTNGNGVAGNPTINLATVTPGTSGSFDKFTTDTFGRVVDYTPVVIGDLTGLLGTYYLPEAGGTMSGAINMGSNQINNLAMAGSPAGTDATNVNYVQSLVNGLEWKAAVTAATTANISLSSAPATIDGVTLTSGQRVLVKNQTDATTNGIYVFNGAGSAMTRSTDANTTALLNNATVFVTDGSQSDTGWTQTTPEPTVGTSNIVFAQFTGSGTYTAGTGLTLSGNTFSITNVGTAGTYGSASSVPVFTTNAQGQVTAVTPTSIAIAGTQVTSGLVGVTYGGTGVNGSTAADGTLLIGNGTGYTLTTLSTSGTGISVTNGAGSITLANTGVTSVIAGTGISVSSGTGDVTINNTGVTSVALAAPSIFTVSGSPVTTTGTLTFSLNTQSANTVFAGPSSGSAAAPTFRALTAADISSVAVNSISFGSTGLTPSSATSGAVTVAGTLVVANGGTGATSFTTNGVVLGGSTLTSTAVGTTGQVLAGNTGSAPTFQTLSGLAVTSISGTTNEITASASVGAVTLSLPSTVVLPGSLEVTTTSKFDGLTYESTSPSVTATGSNPALTSAFNVVTTTGASQGVTLPVPAYAGAEVSIVNVGSNSIAVFPNSGGAIDAAGTNTAISVPAGGTWTGQASSTTQWYSIDPVIVNGTGITVTYSNGQTSISNVGVLSFDTTLSGLTPTTGTAGNVTLSGTLGVASGGTGASTFTTDGVLYGSGTGAIASTAAGTQYQVLQAGSGGVPTFAALNLAQSAAVTGILPSASGGTGVNNSTAAVGTVLAASSTGNFTAAPLVWTGTGAFVGGTPKAITHNLGQQYVLVQVYDNTGSAPSQIIPDSIVLTSSSVVTIGLNQSLSDALVVITGLAGVTAGTF